MLVQVVTILLLLGWPTKIVVLAASDGALPWTRVRLLVLGEVARALELLLAVAACVHDVAGSFTFAATCHRPVHAKFVNLVVFLAQSPLG